MPPLPLERGHVTAPMWRRGLLLLGVGAGFTISGAVLLALDLSEPDPSTQAAFAVPCTAAFCGIAAGGSF